MFTNDSTENTENETEKGSYKISKEQFLEALHANFGLYAQTARYIENKYGISYTRQAVQDRALHCLDEIHQQRDIVHDLAQGAIFKAINQENDPKLQYRASAFLLTHDNFNK